MEEQLELFGPAADWGTGEKEKDKVKEIGTPQEDGLRDSPSSHHSHEAGVRERDQAQQPNGEIRTVWIGLDDELTRRANALVKELGLAPKLPCVCVIWNKRLRTAAGKAFYRDARIELNPRLQLLESPRREEESDRTFLHELAHLVAHARNRRRRIRPHGPEWRQACADLGIPDESACHDLPFAARRMRRKYGYRCPRCGTVLKRVRRIRHHVACLACCRECNEGRYDRRFRLEEFRLPGASEE